MVEMSAPWHKLFLYEHKVILKLSDRWLGHYFYFEQIHREKSIELVWKWQKERLLIWEQIQHSFLQRSLKKCSSKMNKQSKQRIQKTIIVSKQGVKGGFRRAVPISHDWNRGWSEATEGGACGGKGRGVFNGISNQWKHLGETVIVIKENSAGVGGRGGMNWETGIDMYTRLCIK